MVVFSNHQKRRAVGLLLLGGGAIVVGGRLLQLQIRTYQKEQNALCEMYLTKAASKQPISRKPKVAVNARFAGRLGEILQICVPSVFSKEALFILVQSCLLVNRTLLTDRISVLEGISAEAVITKDWAMFMVNLVSFAWTAAPAALVNSGLKYMQMIISLSFQQRLTENLHKLYLSNKVYYVASTLQGLSNADQRITEDVEKFSSAVSELFSYTFKPVLDIILFTRSLSKTIGYKGQFLLYGYFLLTSSLLRSISPPLALMTAQEAALSGNFRNAHQRIVSHAEEIAFNDPPGGDTEQMILNNYLNRYICHSRLSAFQKFVQQVADGYLIKYAASIVGICVYAAPIYYSRQRADTKALTGDYIRSMRLLMNTSTAIGQLILVYKRVTALAGFTSRVSELLESVRQLSTEEGRTQRASPLQKMLEGIDSNKAINYDPPCLTFSDSIEFKHVTLYSPDGSLLVRDLSFQVPRGGSVIIMGPNGSGKSSLFRVLAELWPLQSGTIARPQHGEIFYLSQNPYIVQGTLRDQVRYPSPPLAVSAAASGKWWSSSANLSSLKSMKHPDDVAVIEALQATEIDYLVERGDGLDQLQNWEETLSGGEKQRIAVARVLYHNPRYAVLDECTSAVSADGEENLYRRLQKSGITLLSIAHRPALKKYHSAILYLDGSQGGSGWRYEKLATDTTNPQ